MTNRQWYERLESVGRRVVAELADVALDFYHQPLVAEAKADRSLVSEADRTIEHRARAALAACDVEVARVSAFYGEEFGFLERLLGPELPGSADVGVTAVRGCWILDPIDGTTAFLAQVPTWSILLAYLETGRPVVGIACFPALGEIFCASLGAGAVHGPLDGSVGRGVRPSLLCSVRPPRSLRESMICYSSPSQFHYRGLRSFYTALAEQSGDFRTFPDAFGHVRVLTGHVDAMVDVIANPHDLAAIQILAEETRGACFRPFTMSPAPRPSACYASGGACLSSSAALADELAEVLGSAVDEDDVGQVDGSVLRDLASNALRQDFLRGALQAARQSRLPLGTVHGLVLLGCVEDLVIMAVGQGGVREDSGPLLARLAVVEDREGALAWFNESAGVSAEPPSPWAAVALTAEQVLRLSAAALRPQTTVAAIQSDSAVLEQLAGCAARGDWPKFVRSGWGAESDRSSAVWNETQAVARRVLGNVDVPLAQGEVLCLRRIRRRLLSVAGDDRVVSRILWEVRRPGMSQGGDEGTLCLTEVRPPDGSNRSDAVSTADLEGALEAGLRDLLAGRRSSE